MTKLLLSEYFLRLLMLAMVTLALPLGAQSPYGQHTGQRIKSVLTSSGPANLKVDAEGNLLYLLPSSRQPIQPSSVALGLTTLAVCQQLPGQDAALVAGRLASGGSLLAVVAFAGDQIAVSQQVNSTAGIDCAIWSERHQAIVVVDMRNGSVGVWPWDGSGALPTGRPSIFARRDEIQLLRPQRREVQLALTLSPDEPGVSLLQNGVPAAVRWLLSPDSMGRWTVEEHTTVLAPVRGPYVKTGMDLGVEGPIPVMSSEGGEVWLERLSDGHRQSLGTVPPRQWTRVPLAAGSHMQAGVAYRIAVGEVPSSKFQVFLRSGQVDGVFPCVWEDPFLSVPWCTEGSHKFGVGCRYTPARDITNLQPAEVLVLFASRMVNGASPWQDVAGRRMLIPTSILRIALPAAKQGVSAMVGASLPLNATGFPAGSEVYVQMVAIGVESEPPCVSSISGLPVRALDPENVGSAQLQASIAERWRNDGVVEPAEVRLAYDQLLERLRR